METLEWLGDFMKTTEFERTFLLKHIPYGLEKCRKEEIKDIYVPKTAEHPILRLRKSGNGFEITKKSPVKDDPSEQDEHTIQLTEEEFNVLTSIEGKHLIKTRYHFDYKGKICHIDFFHGSLEGLVIVDFEFEDSEEKERFQKPDFCLVDVTSEVFIAGGMLCGKSYEDIRQKLETLGYTKLQK